MPWLDLDGGYGASLVVEDNSDNGQALAFSIWDLVDAAVTAARSPLFPAEYRAEAG